MRCADSTPGDRGTRLFRLGRRDFHFHFKLAAGASFVRTNRPSLLLGLAFAFAGLAANEEFKGNCA